ncbi:MAG: molybdenum cofactor guanylyltransferase [Candidatus Margulisbacteria bacterium]|nr:molybdenum cofactor guanylyltransferase [Candidatus Margulisiibacteriota bacterium]MBU1617822.1 molybdenum cofactor guanylyltransferase [Candidatus Margulisiibacteriota bacterium]
MSAVILAGGQNSRMGGADKAFLKVGGERIIDRTVALLRELFDELIIVSNSPERYFKKFPEIKIVSDAIKEVGPIGGLQAGLSASSNEAVFVCACDMPALSAEAITQQRAKFEEKQPDCLIARYENRLEPLHSIYRRSLLPVIGQLIEAGQFSIRDLAGRCRKKSYFDLKREEKISLLNLNTPEDLKLINE